MEGTEGAECNTRSTADSGSQSVSGLDASRRHTRRWQRRQRGRRLRSWPASCQHTLQAQKQNLWADIQLHQNLCTDALRLFALSLLRSVRFSGLVVALWRSMLGASNWPRPQPRESLLEAFLEPRSEDAEWVQLALGMLGALGTVCGEAAEVVGAEGVAIDARLGAGNTTGAARVRAPVLCPYGLQAKPSFKVDKLCHCPSEEGREALLHLPGLSGIIYPRCSLRHQPKNAFPSEALGLVQLGCGCHEPIFSAGFSAMRLPRASELKSASKPRTLWHVGQ